jgi:hypothetical protein
MAGNNAQWMPVDDAADKLYLKLKNKFKTKKSSTPRLPPSLNELAYHVQ